MLFDTGEVVFGLWFCVVFLSRSRRLVAFLFVLCVVAAFTFEVSGQGIFVGVRPRSNEIWVATMKRTWKVRPVRRPAEVVRWLSDSEIWASRTMWNRFQGDGDIPEGKAVESPPQEVKPDQAPQERTIVTKRQVLRRVLHHQKSKLRSMVTPVVALAVEVGFVEWASSRIRHRVPVENPNTDVRRCSCAVGKTRKGSGLQRKKLRDNEERRREGRQGAKVTPPCVAILSSLLL